eukprot:2221382-Pyramimonas_sp.AAC.1
MGTGKSPMQIKLEVTLRRVRQIVNTQFPGKRFFSDRERGALSIGWGRAPQVEVAHGDTPPKIYFDIQQLLKHQIEIAASRGALRELARPGGPSQWSL